MSTYTHNSYFFFNYESRLHSRGMARILQAFIDVSTDITDEDKARITLTHTDVLDGYTVTISAIDLIARTWKNKKDKKFR